MNTPKKKRNTWQRVSRIVLKTILFLLLFVVVVILLILTPPVQNFIRKKAVTYLENKLHTRVEIGKLYVGLPKNIILEDIYIEDRQKDTLLSGGTVKINMAILKLIFKSQLEIESIDLENITAKIKRQLPDTAFNYQFIVDAFSPASSSPSVSDTSSYSSPIAINSITLNKARLVFKDIVTGNDAEAWIDHFDTRVAKFDAQKMIIDIPTINISGLVTRVIQTKPLLTPSGTSTIAEVDTVPAITPQFSFGKIDIEKSNLDYRNDVSALYTTALVSSFQAEVKQIDFAEQFIEFSDVSLKNSIASIRLGKKQAAKELIKEVKKKVDSSMKRGWRMEVASFNSADNNLQFDDDNFPRLAKGMDYSHLKALPFTLKATDFLFSDDSIAARIEEASFKEQSGFELQQLKVNFLFSGTEAYLHDLYLKTPGTELKRDAAIQYASLDMLQKDIGNLRVDIDLEKSKLLVKDVLTFVPALRSQPAFADPSTTWYINSRVTGRVADLNIPVFQVSGLSDTRVDIRGRITGLPEMKNFSANLVINNITSSRRDINLFIPPGMLPEDITLPSRLSVRGNLKGNTNDLATELYARTDLGEADIKGTFSQLNDPKKIKYNANVQTRSIDLGTILQDKENLGPVSAAFKVNGTGFDPKTASATFDGTVQSIVLKQYNYKNLALKGTLANQQVNLETAIHDPNIDLSLTATVSEITASQPSLHLSGMIDSIKTEALHLTPEPIVYRGKVDGDFASINPDDLQGNLYLTQSLLVQNGQRFQLDTVQLIAARTDSGHSIQLISDIAVAKLQGQYKLTQLGTIFQQAIDPYFSLTGSKSNAAPVAEPYNFTFNAYVTNSVPLKTFVPALERFDSLTIRSQFSNASWNATVVAPVLDYNGNQIRGFSLQAGAGKDSAALIADVSVKQFSNTSMDLYNTSVKASIANNKINFTADTKDRVGKSRYNFAALFEQPNPGQYSFSFAPEGLLLNYERWTVPADNKIIITSQDVLASNFVLSKSGQQVSISSLSQNAGAPLQVKFTDFRLSTVTAFVQNDSTLVDGSMNGTVTFNNILRDPIFKGDLTIQNLSVKNDTVGNAAIRVSNTSENVYEATALLSGRGNDVQLNGKYFERGNGNSTLDLDLNIARLPLTTVQAFADGAIKSASGDVTGRFAVKGTLDKPTVNGSLNFEKAAFNIAMFNNYFRIDQEKIEVNETGIRFNNFEIKDSLNNPLVLNGTAATSDFKKYKFDLRIRANDFQALNSTKQDNNLFYGKLFFTSNLEVSGTSDEPIVEGRLTVNEKTKMTIVLPQNEPGIVDREGVIEFVDMDAPMNDSLFRTAYDSLNVSSLVGFDVSVNVEVDKAAEFNLVVDEGNGDFLNVKGEASLTTGIDPSGKLTLTGSYELEEGSYELTFNFIKRKFNIQKGSKIIWLGEPTDANVDITAVYTANTAPLDLVKNQLDDNIAVAQRNTYLQKIPFDVTLKMEGKLMKPNISFDILLPEDKNYRVSNDILTNVRTKLDILRQEPGEMNKQVFALLLLNRFIGENPFNSSSGDLSANTLARQSVSKLLTEQLNKLAGDLIEGVDLNFDVASADDYTTGERRDRTDVNVGISKQLLNDRLSVSVGSNFELEGPQSSGANNIAGNVAVNYRVSNDGRYMLRAYRKNEYEGIIDGYIIETGVSFIITVDYNRFRQIFMSKEQRQQRRQKQKANREIRKETQTTEMQQAQQPKP